MKKSHKNGLIGTLFGLVFVLAGLAAGYLVTGKMIIGYVASADWEEVPAQIHHLKLVRKRGDSTTYSVKSRYTYQFNGRTYNASGVSLSTGSDNLGDYWQDLYRSLDSDQNTNESSALVNPSNPSEALLDRTLRWPAVLFGTAMMTVFCGVGGLIMWFSIFGAPAHKKRSKQKQSNGITSDQKLGG